MADFNANEMFEKLLHDLKDQFPLLNEELIINILLENNCKLEATTQELLLYHSLPSSPKVYQQPLIEVPKNIGNLRYIQIVFDILHTHHFKSIRCCSRYDCIYH